jgi:hypothetical protein
MADGVAGEHGAGYYVVSQAVEKMLAINAHRDPGFRTFDAHIHPYAFEQALDYLRATGAFKYFRQFTLWALTSPADHSVMTLTLVLEEPTATIRLHDDGKDEGIFLIPKGPGANEWLNARAVRKGR